MPAAPALRLDLRPSRLLAGGLVLVHGLALAAAWVSLSGWARYLLCLAILASLSSALVKTLRRQALSLELHEDGRASWRNPGGTWLELRMGKAHFVSGVLVVLDLQSLGPGRGKRVVLMPDSMSPQEFRRLRVWLRWRRGPAGPERE
jgi:membrane-bound toxin of toxin-antitoxin system